MNGQTLSAYSSYFCTAEIEGKFYSVVGQDAAIREDVIHLFIDTGVSIEMVYIGDCRPCL